MTFQDAMKTLSVSRSLDAPADFEWSPAFCGACLAVADSVGELRGPELAELLRWCDDNHCYYHGEICTLVSAATNEAARRLDKL